MLVNQLIFGELLDTFSVRLTKVNPTLLLDGTLSLKHHDLHYIVITLATRFWKLFL